jgi:hypothetical protein
MKVWGREMNRTQLRVYGGLDYRGYSFCFTKTSRSTGDDAHAQAIRCL